MWKKNRGNQSQKTGGSVPPLGLFTGGSILNFAPAAGVLNNVNPGGTWFSALIGRLEVDTTAGNAEWTGLVASTVDGYGVMITNLGPNNLQLDSANAGSTAANRFIASGNLVIVPNGRTIAVYDLTRALWLIG